MTIRSFDWDEWKNWSIPAVMNNIENSISFESIGEMSFGDALWSQEGMGIYVFYKDDYVPLYIGKVASRSFLERISGHMDTHIHKGGSHAGWFNTFQKRWVEKFNENDTVAKKNYLKSVAFSTLKMPVNNSDTIKKIEKLMIHHYNPVLNRGTAISNNSKFHYLIENVKRPIGDIK
jgi:hypothetical protein